MESDDKRRMIKFYITYVISTTFFVGSVLFAFYSYLDGGGVRGNQTIFIGQQLQADMLGSHEEPNIISLEEIVITIFLVSLFFIILFGYFFGKLFNTHMHSSFKAINDFIRDATHELNTPISAILMNIELLENKEDCQDKKELTRISIASQTLNRLYEDLIYIQLNHKHLRDIERVNLSKLLKDRLIYFGAMMKSKRVKLIESIDEKVFCELDKNDAIRLIDNLISNSIKYNKKGGEIVISLDEHKFSVKDSGVGMDSKQLKNIFQQFNRSNRSEGGFGIGLSIVKNVVDFYGFKIKVESIPSKGTLATINFE